MGGSSSAGIAAKGAALPQTIHLAIGASLGKDLAQATAQALARFGPVTTTASLPDAEARCASLDAADVFVAHLGPDDGAALGDVGLELSYALLRRRIPTLCLWQDSACACPLPLLTAWASSDELLTVKSYDSADDLDTCIRSALEAAPTPGRIFVIEGGDGAGKQTQTKALVQRLAAAGYPTRSLDFPHDSALHGPLIRRLLSGEFGSMGEVNPLLFASLYAQNRHSVSPLLHWWVRCGYNVVLDRYVEANFGHQASKVPEEGGQRAALVDQLATFEFDWLGLPKSQRVIYLDLPPQDAELAMRADSARDGLDMHETAGDGYKAAVRSTFLLCAEKYGHWTRVPCVANGQRLGKEELSDQIWDLLHPEFVNRAGA